jgi:soluble P-type ATPase
MIDINIPGFRRLILNHLVMDYNGTLALDGHLSVGVRERLTDLSQTLNLHVVTADTHGNVRQFLEGLPCKLCILPSKHQDEAKAAYLRTLGVDRTVAVGNGRNDRLMLKAAVVGVGVINAEGACVSSMVDADIICTSTLDALDLLRFPLRLVATLRL